MFRAGHSDNLAFAQLDFAGCEELCICVSWYKIDAGNCILHFLSGSGMRLPAWPVHDIRFDIQIVDGVVGGTGWSDRLTKGGLTKGWDECCVECLCCWPSSLITASIRERYHWPYYCNIPVIMVSMESRCPLPWWTTLTQLGGSR